MLPRRRISPCIEFGSFALGWRRDDDAVFRLADETPAFFPLANHMDGKLRVGMALADEFLQLLVYRIAGIGQGPLIFFGRIAALHDAEVGGAGANIDDQRVQQCFESVSHGERFRY